MPAKSVAQRRFMGMVRATQKGEMKDPSPEVRDAAKDMSVKAVREFAKTKEKNLPDKKVDEATYPCPESGKKEINERRYVSKHRPPAGWKPYGGYEKEKPEVNATANRIDAIRKSIKTKKEEVEQVDEALTGERYKKAVKKPGGTAYSRMVSADPKKRATRGGRGGESDFGAGDRGSGNKAARRSGTYQEETIVERGDHWHPDPEQDRKLGGPGANQRAREDRAAASKPAAKKEDPKKLRKGESYMDYAKRQKGLKEDAPTMSAGDGGFGGSADANGPTAGFDPPMTGLTTKKPRKFCNKKNKTKRC